MERRIGIIGGSGLYDMEGLKNREWVNVRTPFGKPSDRLLLGEIGNTGTVFLPRHGRGHRILPSEINYRANIWALKKLGVEWIVSVTAVGSFKKNVKPLDAVVVDQFIDRTKSRKDSFFGDGLAVHVTFSHPVCPCLSQIVYECARKNANHRTVHKGGTYLNMEGPAFSTKAESILHRSWGADVIGMTNVTEAKLAREAEICFSTLAMVTDYDCWIEGGAESAVSVDMIVQNLVKNSELAQHIVRDLVTRLPEKRECECTTALQNALITDRKVIPSKTIHRLGLILNRYLSSIHAQ